LTIKIFSGVELSQLGNLCSFDAFLSKYGLDDPALHQLATIVRGADTSRLDLTPQSAGLFAISLGLSANFADDHEMPGHGRLCTTPSTLGAEIARARRTTGFRIPEQEQICYVCIIILQREVQT
jgi:hypothetical protein